MLFYLHTLKDIFFGFNIFRYITFRLAIAAVIAMAITYFLGKPMIKFLQKLNFGQVIRTDGPDSHRSKKGTPTMGGILITLSVIIATLLCGRLNNPKVLFLLGTLVTLTALGFLDDYLKIKLKNSAGVPGWVKITVQAAVGLAVGIFLYYFDQGSTFMLQMKELPGHGVGDGIHLELIKKTVESSVNLSTSLFVPFFSEFHFDLKLLYIPFAVIVVVGASNSANLTDGLDGLAVGVMLFMLLAYTILAYVIGTKFLAAYLLVPHIVDVAELSVFTAALIGAGMGFLWFNAHPAQVFMGDAGALSIGGVLGVIAIFLKQELLLLIVGGVYVIETLSVIIQVLSFKLTGKRVFRMTPIHHHFELQGYKESKIVIRFWILAAILALVGIATLKIR